MIFLHSDRTQWRAWVIPVPLRYFVLIVERSDETPTGTSRLETSKKELVVLLFAKMVCAIHFHLDMGGCCVYAVCDFHRVFTKLLFLSASFVMQSLIPISTGLRL